MDKEHYACSCSMADWCVGFCHETRLKDNMSRVKVKMSMVYKNVGILFIVEFIYYMLYY